MTNKNIFKRYLNRGRTLLLLASLLFQQSVLAGHELPKLDTNQEIEEYIARMIDGSPWLRAYVAEVRNQSAISAKLIAKLQKDDEWIQLAEERPDGLALIHIQKPTVEKRNVYSAKISVNEERRAAVAQVLKSLSSESSKPILESLREKIITELVWLQTNEYKAIVTGLINVLPAPERAALFKMASPEQQIDALSKNSNFTDDAAKASFRGEAFNLEKSQVTRESLLNFANTSLTRENQLVTLLRAVWFLNAHGRRHVDIEIGLNNAEAAMLDPFNLPEADLKLFTDQMAGEFMVATGKNDQATLKKITQFLSRLAKQQVRPEDYEMHLQNVEVPGDVIKVEEVSAEVGAYRGYLMMDCSMGAYGFAYTPQEYVFLAYNKLGEPVGFIVGTAVIANGQKTLFIHDFGGQKVNSEVVSYALHGLYLSLADLGFEQMTIKAANGNYGSYSRDIHSYSGANVAQTYLDAKIRRIIQTDTGYGNNYDMPTNSSNLSAPLFVPSATEMANYRVQFWRVGAAPGGAQAQKTVSKPEAIIRAFGLYNANPDLGVTPEMLKTEGIRAQDLREIFRQIDNPERRNLENYYAGLTELFAKFDIQLTRNFIREYSYLFWAGHLNAADATTTQDAALANRTVEYSVLTLKKRKDLDHVVKLITNNRQFFEQSERFQNYLKSFVARGENEPRQIEILLGLGFKFDHLANDIEALKRLSQVENITVQGWAFQHWPKTELKNLPPEGVRALAKRLDQKTDDAGVLQIVKMLERTNYHDPAVLNELKETAESEDVEETGVRAALMLMGTDQFSRRAAKRLIKNEKNMDLPPAVRRRLAKALQKLTAENNAELCAAILKMNTPKKQ